MLSNEKKDKFGLAMIAFDRHCGAAYHSVASAFSDFARFTNNWPTARARDRTNWLFVDAYCPIEETLLGVGLLLPSRAYGSIAFLAYRRAAWLMMSREGDEAVRGCAKQCWTWTPHVMSIVACRP